MKETTIERMNWLSKQNGKRFYKYLRNLRLYTASPTLSLTNMLDNEIPGYYSNQYGSTEIEDDTTPFMNENVIKSAIETLISMIASKKVRPFFNTINGTFKDITIAKQAQHFFDLTYDRWNVNEVVSMAFRDACIFDTGYVYINKDDARVERVMPWQMFFDPRQLAYDKPVDVLYKQTQVPTILLDDRITTDEESVDVCHYWNIKTHKHVVYIPKVNYYDEEEYDSDTLPFVTLYYNKPLKGRSSNSVVDDLMGIQLEIDSILQKIKDASQLTPSNTIFVPEGSDIMASKLSNRVGEVITYSLTPNMTGSPVSVATPSFIDPEYLQLLSQLKQDAFEIVGVSKLSAASQKPEGLNSGVALATMENIESERFETQLNQVIRCYTDIAKKVIDIFDGSILPIDKNRISITWNQVKKAARHMSLQFSAAESLSKDPSQKLQQLQQLAAAGVLPQTRIAQLMELPDLQTGYNIANNAINAVMTVIQRCIENDDYEVPMFIPLDMLKEEIVNCCLSLEAGNAEENYDDIQKLLKLYYTIEDKQKEMQDQATNLEAEQMALGDLDQKNAQIDQNSAQLDDIANQVQNGTMNPEQAQQFLQGLQMGQ